MSWKSAHNINVLCWLLITRYPLIPLLVTKLWFGHLFDLLQIVTLTFKVFTCKKCATHCRNVEIRCGKVYANPIIGDKVVVRTSISSQPPPHLQIHWFVTSCDSDIYFHRLNVRIKCCKLLVTKLCFERCATHRLKVWINCGKPLY